MSLMVLEILMIKTLIVHGCIFAVMTANWITIASGVCWKGYANIFCKIESFCTCKDDVAQRAGWTVLPENVSTTVRLYSLLW